MFQTVANDTLRLDFEAKSWLIFASSVFSFSNIPEQLLPHLEGAGAAVAGLADNDPGRGRVEGIALARQSGRTKKADCSLESHLL